MHLPRPRGPLSEALTCTLRRPPHAARITEAPAKPVLDDDDAQLALFVLYQLHYHGFDEVDDRWEWQPDLLGVRAALEASHERELRAACSLPTHVPVDGLASALVALVEADDSPSVAAYVQRSATLDQVRELLMIRSIYQLAEADPHTFGIPRLEGRPKAALVEIQADEYGGGRPERMHSELFVQTMQALGLDTAYGAYLDQIPATSLAAHNTMSMFGLHRRLRGALLGHLAALEMTSSLPNRRYGQGLRRLGFDEQAAAYFDEHIEADAVHEQIAVHDMCVPFARQYPELAEDVLFGAAANLVLDAVVAERMLLLWKRGESALAAESRVLV